MPKQIMVAAKVSAGQKQVIRSAAAAEGMTESAWLRRLALAEASRVLSQAAAAYAAPVPAGAEQ